MTVLNGFDGIHHLKLPVADLEAATRWWVTLFDARRVVEFDHIAPDGTLFAVVIEVPSVQAPIELRLAPGTAAAIAGFDPLTIAVADRDSLAALIAKATSLGVDNSGMMRGAIGWVAAFHAHDGLVMRVYTRETHEWDVAASDFESPWVRPLPRDEWNR